MKKRWLPLLFALATILLIAGCGQKTQEDVVSDLNAKVEKMKGYEVTAKLTVKTGTEPQVYDVDIWHNKPSYYRVHLKNAQKDQSQIILRNQEGVFVLTPALKKSFRFQSNWPENSSQAYLYESLVRDIMKDKEATFTVTDANYVFQTKTNYQNHNMIPKQEITFSKKDLAPVTVKLMDTDDNVLVQVDFSEMKFDAKFDEGAFDTNRNMSSAQMEIPTTAEQNEPFSVLYPNDTPQGMTLKEEKELKGSNGRRVILTYTGEDKTFTLIQEQARVSPTSATIGMSGEPIDLGFTVGALTENSVTWSYGGVDYMIASKNLSQEELLMVARSVYQIAEK